MLLQQLLWLSAPEIESPVRTGQEYEQFVARYLARSGYHHIRHTGRTGDFGVDIVARKGMNTYAIQCKYYSKAVDGSAVQQVVAGKSCYGCNAAMVVTNQTLTNGARILAEKNCVQVLTGVAPIRSAKQMSLERWMTPAKLIVIASGSVCTLVLLDALQDAQMFPNLAGCLVLAVVCFALCHLAVTLLEELWQGMFPQQK